MGFKIKNFFLLIILILLQSCSGGRIGNFLETSFKNIKEPKIKEDTENKMVTKLEENIENVDYADTENGSVSDELIKLNDLFESEVITKEEFEKAKKKLLDK